MRLNGKIVPRLLVALAFALVLVGLTAKSGLAVDHSEQLQNAKAAEEFCKMQGGSYQIIDGGPNGVVLGLCTFADGSSCLTDFSTYEYKGTTCTKPFTNNSNQGPNAMQGGENGGVYAESDPVPPQPTITIDRSSQPRVVERPAATDTTVNDSERR